MQWMGGAGGGVRGVMMRKQKYRPIVALFPNNVRVCGIVYHK